MLIRWLCAHGGHYLFCLHARDQAISDNQPGRGKRFHGGGPSDKCLHFLPVLKDGELTAQTTLLEHVAEERRIRETLFDQQNVRDRPGNSCGRETAKLDVSLAPG